MRYEDVSTRFYTLNIINVKYIINMNTFNNYNNLLTLSLNFIA